MYRKKYIDLGKTIRRRLSKRRRRKKLRRRKRRMKRKMTKRLKIREKFTKSVRRKEFRLSLNPWKETLVGYPIPQIA